MSKPNVEKTEITYRGFFDVRVDTLSLPGKEPSTYTVLQTAEEAAVVLGITPQGKLIINREYRHPAGSYLLGLPGGRLDPNEKPLTAAKREFLEETGYTAEEFQHLITVFPFPAVCAQKIHYYFAKNATRISDPTREPYELIETLEVSYEELMAKLQGGEDAIDGVLFPALAFYMQIR